MRTRAGFIFEDATLNYATIASKFFDKMSKEEKEKNKKKLAKYEEDMIGALPELFFATDEDWHTVLTKEHPFGKALNLTKKVLAGLENPDTAEMFDEEIYRPLIQKVSNEGYRVASDKEYPTHSVRKRITNFTGEPIYRRPGMRSVDNLEEDYIADVGRDAIVKILKGVVDVSGEKVRNLMVDNVEYNTKTVTDIKEAVGGSIRTYITYKDSDNDLITKDFRKLIDGTAIGNHVIVKRNCMDVVLQKFTFDQEFYGSTPRSLFADEADKLYSRVRKDGIVLVEVPRFIMRSKECLDIARRFELEFAYKIPVKAEWFNTDYVLLALRPRKYVFTDVGKDEDLAVREQTYNRLMKLELATEVSDEMVAHLVQDLPKSEYGQVELFMGEQIDKALVEIVFEESTLSINSINKKEQTLEPVMPPSKGQLGQIIASGRLDGIIDEGNGYKHVIRGRVHKGYESSTDYEELSDGTVKKIEKKVHSNVIEVNYFGGDGTYKTLATSAKCKEE